MKKFLFGALILGNISIHAKECRTAIRDYNAENQELINLFNEKGYNISYGPEAKKPTHIITVSQNRWSEFGPRVYQLGFVTAGVAIEVTKANGEIIFYDEVIKTSHAFTGPTSRAAERVSQKIWRHVYHKVDQNLEECKLR